MPVPAAVYAHSAARSTSPARSMRCALRRHHANTASLAASVGRARITRVLSCSERARLDGCERFEQHRRSRCLEPRAVGEDAAEVSSAALPVIEAEHVASDRAYRNAATTLRLDVG